jgi:hypothetical protein
MNIMLNWLKEIKQKSSKSTKSVSFFMLGKSVLQKCLKLEELPFQNVINIYIIMRINRKDGKTIKENKNTSYNINYSFTNCFTTLIPVLGSNT